MGGMMQHTLGTGNLVYSVGHSSKWIILLARLLVGLGSGGPLLSPRVVL